MIGQLTKTQKGLGQVQNVANWYNEEIYTYDNYGNRTGTEVYEDINKAIKKGWEMHSPIIKKEQQNGKEISEKTMDVEH